MSMEIDSPQPPGVSTLGVNGQRKPAILTSSTDKVTDIIGSFRPTRHCPRDTRNTQAAILSLDFNDNGELLLSSESDESIRIYNVKEGKHSKTAQSKKYGAKLAKFAHADSCVVYASTKENNDIRYLSTHDNSFIRYFRGHEMSVTCLAFHPGEDTFMSCSEDNTVRIWDTNTSNCCGYLNLYQPKLAAFDPSGHVVAIASEAAQAILLYDFRQYDREPFATFDLVGFPSKTHEDSMLQKWNKLEFSNDGKTLLVGCSGRGHVILDAFEGTLKAYLGRDKNGPRTAEEKTAAESMGDACFSPDGRYVLSGQKRQSVLVWDTFMQPKETDKVLQPLHELESKTAAAVIAFNPRFNMFASGDNEVVMWLPDRDSI